MRYRSLVIAGIAAATSVVGACKTESFVGPNEEQNALVYTTSWYYPGYSTVFGGKAEFFDDQGHLVMILEDYSSGELCDESLDRIVTRNEEGKLITSQPIVPSSNGPFEEYMELSADSYIAVDECRPYAQEYKRAVAGVDSMKIVSENK